MTVTRGAYLADKGRAEKPAAAEAAAELECVPAGAASAGAGLEGRVEGTQRFGYGQ